MPCERRHVEAIDIAQDRIRSASTISGLEELHSAIDAALATCDESPWRSMESAPRDGTHVLLTAGGFVWVAYWIESFGAWTDPDTILGLSENDSTHWMPLPAAPEVKP